MNGVHDMGGMHGFGPVEHEENEPVFHVAWEGRIYAITRILRAGGGHRISTRRVMRLRSCHRLSTCA